MSACATAVCTRVLAIAARRPLRPGCDWIQGPAHRGWAGRDQGTLGLLASWTAWGLPVDAGLLCTGRTIHVSGPARARHRERHSTTQSLLVTSRAPAKAIDCFICSRTACLHWSRLANRVLVGMLSFLRLGGSTTGHIVQLHQRQSNRPSSCWSAHESAHAAGRSSLGFWIMQPAAACAYQMARCSRSRNPPCGRHPP